MILSWLVAVVIAIVAVAAILLVRNELVYTFRLRRIAVCGEAAIKAINEGKEWRQYWRSFDALTYDSMLFDFRKWTYNQFYGDIE